MREVLVHDVGDGNHIDMLGDWWDSAAKVDFGTSGPKDKLFRPGTSWTWGDIHYFLPPTPYFILSHHHADHYNGFIAAACNKKYQQVRFHFRHVYYPRFPSFPNHRLVMRQILFLNRLILGDTSGSRQYDLLRLIRSCNSQTFRYSPVKQGDEIPLGADRIEVIWPPDTIVNGNLNRAVDTAMRLFDALTDTNSDLRDRYERMNEIPAEPGEFDLDEDDRFALDAREELREQIHEVNEALRRVANRLSLAFLVGEQLLFLGDLEEEELRAVIDHMKANHRFNHTNCLVAAHHGTHWDERLRDVFAHQVVVSNGSSRAADFCEEYKDISSRVRSTFLEGDISVEPHRRLTSR